MLAKEEIGIVVVKFRNSNGDFSFKFDKRMYPDIQKGDFVLTSTHSLKNTLDEMIFKGLDIAVVTNVISNSSQILRDDLSNVNKYFLKVIPRDEIDTETYRELYKNEEILLKKAKLESKKKEIMKEVLGKFEEEKLFNILKEYNHTLTKDALDEIQKNRR